LQLGVEGRQALVVEILAVDVAADFRAPEPELAPSQSAEALAIEHLEAERVRAALVRLPDRDRAMMVLRYWEDLPVEAVARTLGMSDGAVRVALMRARRTLGAMLAMEESGVEV